MAVRLGSITGDNDVEGMGFYEFNTISGVLYRKEAALPWSGNTAFHGTINGTPTATNVPYTPTSGENSLAIGAVLHNTTKGELVRISGVDEPGNNITVDANSPDDASTWSNTDAIETESQTVTTDPDGEYVDIDATAHLSITKGTPIAIVMGVTTSQRNADAYNDRLHPLVAFDLNQAITTRGSVGDGAERAMYIVPLVKVGSRFYFCYSMFNLSADNGHISMQFGGQFTQLT